MKQIISLLALITLSMPAFATSNWLHFTGVESVTITQSAENSPIHYEYRDDDVVRNEDATEEGFRVRIKAKSVEKEIGSGGRQLVGNEIFVSFGFDPNNPLHQACLTTIANAENITFHDTGAGIGCSNVK